jgi:TatD DNase family protein
MFHSWTGSLKDAKRAIALGFYISFSGIVTFKNAGEIVDVAKWAPIDRILVETDSPFLSPIPFRGRQNEPKNVKITAQFLANLRNSPFNEIADATTRNALKLFNIK